MTFKPILWDCVGRLLAHANSEMVHNISEMVHNIVFWPAAVDQYYLVKEWNIAQYHYKL